MPSASKFFYFSKTAEEHVSTFKVEKTKISNIIPIEGADKIELAQIVGTTYQFIVGKGQFQVGREVVYFPIDSILPQPLIEHFGIAKFLSGKDHNRIKTTKFLQKISQGYVASVESVSEYISKAVYGEDVAGWSDEGEDFYTRVLGVTKYEAPTFLQKNAKLIPLDMRAYDIEGISRYQNVVDYLMDKDVVITEKCEGMNLHITLKADGAVKYGQRNFYIESNDPEKPHSFEVVSKEQLLPLAKKLQTEKFPNSDVRIRGEFLGNQSQGNYYNIKGNKVAVFEIDINGKPIDAIDLLDLVKEYNIDFVPILHVGKLSDFLNGKTVQEASHGKSKLVDKMREGLVIRPCREQYSPDLDSRLIVKHRSEEYLAKTDF